MSKKKNSQTFHNSLKTVAKELSIDPSEVTKTQYFDSGSAMSEWDVRQLGGFSTLKKHFYPEEKNLVETTATKLVRAHRNKLDNFVGKEQFFKQEFLAVFKEVMAETEVKYHAPVKKQEHKGKIERTLVAHFSDTHYGCNIDPNELNGANSFNWTIAARRSACLIDQVVNYKPEYRDSTDLVILINGDIIAGVIHDQEWAVDLLTTQFSGTLSIFTQGISYAAQHFRKVRVICTPGNHGRAMHKSSKDRATVHKWDSYEGMIYVALREALKAHRNVSFDIPETPYAITDIQGHKFLTTHGDTVVNVGNPGGSINMRSINEQINKVNTQLIKGDQNFAAILVGHVHVPTIQQTDSGTMLLVNGTLSGLDAYAQSIGIFSSHPSQTIFEVTPKHPVGDMRLIRLKDADDNARFDKIIAPFKGKF